jgi:hypothetical protein
MRPLLRAILLALAATAPGFAQAPTPVAPVVRTPEAEAAYQEWVRKHNEWSRNYAAWEIRYKKWLEEQARLDDGLMISVAGGFSPSRINTTLSGGNRIDFPDDPPYSNINLRGLGGTLDLRVGWMVQNDPYLKDYYFGADELHDQLYFSLDFIARTTPYTQLRFNHNDTANAGGDYAKAANTLDLMVGLGTTYLIYPYRVSFSTSVGLGLVAIRKIASDDPGYDNSNIRTALGPAFNFRVGQEWALYENWRTGFALSYGYIRAVNPQRVNAYREAYSAHNFSIQWVNTFTPPKYLRGEPPRRPQQWRPDVQPTP